MKQLFFLLTTLLTCSGIYAQTKKPAVLAMPDINAILKMTPAEQEAYKEKMLKQYSSQAKEIANKNNLKINEMELPDFKVQLPPKDFKRLSFIPQQPPTLIQLADGLRAAKKQIETKVSKPVLEEVKQITTTQSPEQQHSSAVGEFYGGKPEQAILVAVNSVLQNPDNANGWNNLAAMFNMTGLEHKAIPILMNQLQSDPNNSMMLNNMGQAYLGLGDISMSEMFLKKCLEHDPMHPEANRSMGMIKFAYEQYDEGMPYFEKELEMVYRSSSMALLRSKNKALNLYKLRKKRSNMPQHNYFDELQLGNFNLPALPEKTDQSQEALAKFRTFGESVQAEIIYWDNQSNLSPEEIKEDGKRYHGVYFNLVEGLLKDLGDLYTPQELSLFNDLDLNHIQGLMNEYNLKLAAVTCPTAPAGASFEENAAFIKKCCDLKKPIMDAFVAQYNAFVTACAKRGLGMWKEYINDLINIASLEPSAGNKVMIYKAMSGYFIFLSSAGMGQFIDPPSDCYINLTQAETDSLIQSTRRLDLKCPQALNFELDMQIFKAKLDCNKYALEGGKLFQLGYEYAFKTGTTTLTAGVGAKAKFTKVPGSAEIKQMAFVSFDATGFTDAGLLGKASAKIGDTPFKIGEKIGEHQDKLGGTYIGIEGGYTLGINSGWKGYVKGTGALADFVQIK